MLHQLQADVVRTLTRLVESKSLGVPSIVRFVLPKLLLKWQTKTNATRHISEALQATFLNGSGKIAEDKLLRDVRQQTHFTSAYPPLSCIAQALIVLLRPCGRTTVEQKVLPSLLSQVEKYQGLRLADLSAVLQVVLGIVSKKAIVENILCHKVLTLMYTLPIDDCQVTGLAHMYLAHVVSMSCSRVGEEAIPSELFSSLAILLQKLVQRVDSKASATLAESVEGTIAKAFYYPLSVLLGARLLETINIQTLPPLLSRFLSDAPISFLDPRSNDHDLPTDAIDEPLDVCIGSSWGGRLVDTFTAHRSGIATLEVDLQERFLITSSKGGTVKLWDISSSFSPKELAHVASTPTAFPSKTVNAVRIVDGAQRAALLDGALRIWDIGAQKTQAVNVGRTCRAMVAMEAVTGSLVDGDARGNVLWVASAYGALGRVDLRLPAPLVATYGLPGGFWGESALPLPSCSLAVCGNRSVGLVCVGRASGQISVSY